MPKNEVFIGHTLKIHVQYCIDSWNTEPTSESQNIKVYCMLKKFHRCVNFQNLEHKKKYQLLLSHCNYFVEIIQNYTILKKYQKSF